jgi:hypothetical protein
MAIKNIRTEFTQLPASEVISSVDYSHDIIRGKLKGSDKVWIRKEISDPADARLELLAQEFFRLIIPHQPETRIAKDPTTGVFYILSEEVRGYKALPVNQGESFSDGTFTGLGQVLTTSMFLEETDLKNGNLGLNNKNQVIKIDGDCCFWQLYFPEKLFTLNQEAIASLPYPKGYFVYNWLGFFSLGEKQKNSDIVKPELGQSAQFGAEVNQALLKIYLLPTEYISTYR